MASVARNVISQIARVASGEALVLLYHRIAEPICDPQLLCVHQQRFSRHLAVLRSRCKPISLGELSDGLRRGRLPRRAVAVTFDDGYVDNLAVAKPLLERYGVPATVFVSTGSIGRAFWWDRVERLILRSTTTARCGLRICGRELAWAFPAEPSVELPWNATEPPRNERQRVYLEVSSALREADTHQRDDAIVALAEWAGASSPPADARAMTAHEIVALSRGGLVEIGAHGVSHSRFASLSPEERRVEMLGCKATLESILGRSVLDFAYPFGALGDQPYESAAEARGAGFRSAFLNHHGVAWIGTNRYRIPRALVRDWDESEFETLLDGWLRGS